MYYSDLETGIERNMNGRDLYKMALRVLIGAVGLSAALGIFALLPVGPRRMERQDP